MSKEQYDPTFSPDGRFAAFAERNWNELTYIVVADLVRDVRIELPYFGSFPVIRSGHVVFSCDPTFVRAPFKHRHDVTSENPSPEASFRQIASWALYAFDIRTRRSCHVGSYDHQVQAEP